VQAKFRLQSAQSGSSFARFQLVHFRRYDQWKATDRDEPSDRLMILGRRHAAFHQQYDGPQLFSPAQVLLDQGRPLRAD